jgi:uncharacterized protein
MTELKLALSGGSSVTARRYPATGLPQATLVLAHGAGAGQSHPFLVKFATALAERGLTVFTFNFPYIEARRSAPDPAARLESCYRDVVAAIADHSGRHGPLFIGGKSMGGRIATLIAAQPSSTAIAGIVLLGYPLHPPGKPENLRVAHLASIRVPLLFIQGTRDPFGTPAELAPFLKPLRDLAAVHTVEGGDHSFAVPKTGPRSQAEVHTAIQDTIVEWIGRVTTSQAS